MTEHELRLNLGRLDRMQLIEIIVDAWKGLDKTMRWLRDEE